MMYLAVCLRTGLEQKRTASALSYLSVCLPGCLSAHLTGGARTEARKTIPVVLGTLVGGVSVHYLNYLIICESAYLPPNFLHIETSSASLISVGARFSSQ
ncbi:hypothetical protein GGR56DRAFT_614333 [Xylariaceae sp. FL0804]|nr:hypothetical protein GGR56DRAFT_614333 [Xylariaceae sp. FL0804]